MTERAKRVIAGITAASLAVSLCPLGAVALASDNNVGKGRVASQWSQYLEPVDQAVAALQEATWQVSAKEAPSASAATRWLQAQMEALGISGVHYYIDTYSASYVAATDGTADAPLGVPGAFTAKVNVYRSWLDNTFAAHRVPVQVMLVPAAYAGPDPQDPGLPEEVTKPDDPKKPVADPSKPSVSESESPAPGGEDSGKDEGEQKPPIHPLMPPAPVAKEEAVQNAQEQIASQLSADPEAWSIQEGDMPADASFEGEEGIKNVETWVYARLASQPGLVPEGFLPDIRNTIIDEEPAADGSRGFSCQVYLVEVLEKDDGAQPEAQDASEASDIALHPLHATIRTASVTALPEEASAEINDGNAAEPFILITGRTPRTLRSSAGQQQDGVSGKHPLANGGANVQRQGGTYQISSDGENAREVKHPDQLGTENPAASSSSAPTTVQRGSTIASTSDASGPITFLSMMACLIAGTVAALSVRRIRKR